MVKVFTTNSNGKIEFTKDELEKLLNEVWQNGYNSSNSYWWTSPNWWTSQTSITPVLTDKTVITEPPITIVCE